MYTHDISRYSRLGVVDIITKPFDPLALPDRLAKIWETLDHER